MALEHAILGFLDAEPMSGYDLKTRCFDSAAGHLWTADQAQVYRTLDRLKRSGLVRSRLVPQRGKPDRRVYTITDGGRRELAAWLRRPEDPAVPRDPFLMHLFFAGRLSDDEVLELLSHARLVYQGRLERLRARSAKTAPCPADAPRDTALRDMTIQAGMSAARTAIDWIDDCSERIVSGLPALDGLDTTT